VISNSSSDRHHAHHLVQGHVAGRVHLEEEHQRGEGHGEGADDDQAGDQVEVAEGLPRQVEAGEGDERERQHAGEQPRLGPVGADVLEGRRVAAGAHLQVVLDVRVAALSRHLREQLHEVEQADPFHAGDVGHAVGHIADQAVVRIGSTGRRRRWRHGAGGRAQGRAALFAEGGDGLRGAAAAGAEAGGRGFHGIPWSAFSGSRRASASPP